MTDGTNRRRRTAADRRRDNLRDRVAATVLGVDAAGFEAAKASQIVGDILNVRHAYQTADDLIGAGLIAEDPHVKTLSEAIADAFTTEEGKAVQAAVRMTARSRDWLAGRLTAAGFTRKAT